MNIIELLTEIDLEFERYADGQGSVSLEYLRSKIRMLITDFCEEIKDIVEGNNAQ
jgi:hypothetical protein